MLLKDKDGDKDGPNNHGDQMMIDEAISLTELKSRNAHLNN